MHVSYYTSIKKNKNTTCNRKKKFKYPDTNLTKKTQKPYKDFLCKIFIAKELNGYAMFSN